MGRKNTRTDPSPAADQSSPVRDGRGPTSDHHGRGPAPELGAALAAHSDQLSDAIVDQWRAARSGDDDQTVESAIRSINHAGILAVADYLRTGEIVTRQRSETWDVAGAAPFMVSITLSEVMKLYLFWRELCIRFLREEAARLGSTPEELEHGVGAVTIGCNTSLVRMAQRFEVTRRQLEAQLAEKQARLEHQALHDPLTGLANRVLLLDRLDHALGAMDRHTTRPAVLFLDLDHFKSVNDARGHTVGDQLLVEVAARLHNVTRPSDTMARLGGDEFVVLCEELHDPIAEGTAVAERVIESLQQPFAIGRRETYVSASIGVAAAGPGDNAEMILARADQAMYRAKQLGRGRVELYDPAIDRAANRYAELSTDLHHALAEGQLHVAYQPVFDVNGTDMVTKEALLRWLHPRLGAIAPDEFVPVAEETGLITGIGHWVLERACQDCVAWQGAGEPGVGVSVNVSGRQLETRGFESEVAEVLGTAGLAATTLTLEVTETLLVAGRAEAREALEKLRSMGIRIAIDDFGTGYSSLSWLARLPLDVLKVDRSFVSALGVLERESAIVQAMIHLAHTLGLDVVAEGVETEPQLAHLRRIGCNQVQGYLLGRPQRIPSGERSAVGH